ncbi:amidohydrolase [Mycobacterium sp. 21AC1]|uniref:amidohydrolase family protein n=1 Tax=[Mycobacterium] appelbergii TaxID=2939269 RepID=UPI002938E9A2|nr:amidohydrolase family protein [Mycobacterium sp. 21AC1]MDV3128630.1 amidohydrolase [Mycobacterium sp. 21AC1]
MNSQTEESTLGRIDVHQHIVPPAWRSAMETMTAAGTAWPQPPRWSPPAAVAFMDDHEIDTGILSVTAPGVVLPGFTARDAQALAVAVNDQTAEVVKDRPDRFGFFASLPLPDVDGAIAEAARAFDELSADGVVLQSNVRGRYLGDSSFEPLWAELNERSAVVHVHPNQPPLPALAGTPFPLADFVFDTTRSALDLVLRGVPRRYPRMRMILSHGGGFLPYAAHRFAALAPEQVDANLTTTDLLTDLQWFYLDTALAASPTSWPALRAFAAPGHVLYGSDWPLAPPHVSTYFDTHLEAVSSPDEFSDVCRGAAQRLFPRLEARLETHRVG